jgi:alkylhydroperoxidase/carboxymuconolactone decarboxylase family protein YurZ
MVDKNEYIDLFHKLKLNLVAFKPLFRCDDEVLTLVNAALAQRTWVGLTDDEIKAIIGHNHPEGIGSYAKELFKQIEAKLREKNCG